jgi:hypothetical protein
VADEQDVTLAGLRNEMARLTRLMMKASTRYLEREQTVRDLHAQEATNYTGNLSTLLDKDQLLNSYSGASKTLATLATACADVIQAEIAYIQFTGVRPAVRGGRRG